MIPAASWLESIIFPHLRSSLELDSTSQPFVLLVEQQPGWGIISWGKPGFSLLAALFTFGVMLTYARLYFRNEIARAERYLQISKAMIIGLDRNGNVNMINRQGCETLGYSEKELLGKNRFETAVSEYTREDIYNVFRTRHHRSQVRLRVDRDIQNGALFGFVLPAFRCIH